MYSSTHGVSGLSLASLQNELQYSDSSKSGPDSSVLLASLENSCSTILESEEVSTKYHCR